MTVSTHLDLATGASWRKVVVACGARDRECTSRMTAIARNEETDSAAERRILASALAGRWRRHAGRVYCPLCIDRLAIPTPRAER